MIVFLCGVALPARAQDFSQRLPRERFDVIAPDTRVEGTRGAMRIVEDRCRVGPTHWARRRIVDIAAQEWAAFGFQTADSTVVGMRVLPDGVVSEALNPVLPKPRVAREYLRLGAFDDAGRVAATIAGYWSATPEGRDVLAEQNAAWRAPGGRDVHWLQPWSAAFVSWVMCEAGLGEARQFARDASHRVYIDQAIAARDGGAPDAAFVAYDAGEAEIEPGDLLCNGRGRVDYRTLADRRRDAGAFAPTHCDIVVKTDAAHSRMFVIGGNVLTSVTLNIVPTAMDARGHARPIDDTLLDGARTVFAHLKLRADAVEAQALDNSPTVRSFTAP